MPFALRPSPEKAFLFLALIFGTAFCLITPPFQAIDEEFHFFRACQLSEGAVLSEVVDGKAGHRLPKSIEDAISLTKNLQRRPDKKYGIDTALAELNISLNEKDKNFVPFPNSAVYSPVPYLPQALGIFIGRFFQLQPVFLIFLGRFLNLLAWTLLVYSAIKTAPVLKWFFFTLSLMPMTIFTAASLSADAATIGLAFLLTATALNFARMEKTIGAPEMARLFALTVMLSLSKQIYVVLALIVFLIPSKKFHSKKAYSIFLAGLLILNLAANVTWTFQVKDYLNYENGAAGGEQIRFILENIFSYLWIVSRTFLNELRFYLVSLVGILGWYDTHFPSWFYFSFLLILMLALLFENSGNINFNARQKIILFLVPCSCLLLNYTAIYVTFNPVGSREITGMQGRYFIPLIPMLSLAVISKRPLFSGKLTNAFHGALLILSPLWLVFTCLVLARRFYLPL